MAHWVFFKLPSKFYNCQSQNLGKCFQLVVEGTYLDNFHYWHVLIQATLLYVKILKTEEGAEIGGVWMQKIKI